MKEEQMSGEQVPKRMQWSRMQEKQIGNRYNRSTVVGKDKKLSIHERLEINKRIIQEKQGKDKPERGADRGVR